MEFTYAIQNLGSYPPTRCASCNSGAGCATDSVLHGAQVLREHPNPATLKPGTLTATRALAGSVDMGNVLSEEKKQQVIALGKLGWSLRASRKQQVSVDKPRVLT
jgi:hypothetical protein